jgi:hypothetical protein
MFLSALLKGKALEVYFRLPLADTKDYDELKRALCRRFQLTEDGFREKLRNAKPETGESPSQFLTRLGTYLLRWVEMAGVDQSFVGLTTLIVKEQYISTCNKELYLFEGEMPQGSRRTRPHCRTVSRCSSGQTTHNSRAEAGTAANSCRGSRAEF